MKITFTQLTEIELVSQENCKLIKKNAIPFFLSPCSLDQRSNLKRVEFDWLLKNGYISWYFIFISLTSQERSTRRCGRAPLWRKNPSYSQKTRGLRVCPLYTAVSRSGLVSGRCVTMQRIVTDRPLTHAQLFKRNQNFLFQSLPHPFRWTWVTDALETRFRRTWL